MNPRRPRRAPLLGAAGGAGARAIALRPCATCSRSERWPIGQLARRQPIRPPARKRWWPAARGRTRDWPAWRRSARSAVALAGAGREAEPEVHGDGDAVAPVGATVGPRAWAEPAVASERGARRVCPRRIAWARVGGPIVRAAQPNPTVTATRQPATSFAPSPPPASSQPPPVTPTPAAPPAAPTLPAAPALPRRTDTACRTRGCAGAPARCRARACTDAPAPARLLPRPTPHPRPRPTRRRARGDACPEHERQRERWQHRRKPAQRQHVGATRGALTAVGVSEHVTLALGIEDAECQAPHQRGLLRAERPCANRLQQLSHLGGDAR